MSVNLITGYAGTAHITSAGDGAVNAGMFGSGKYVLNIGEKFAYEVISNNLIRIKSGYAINQGRKIELAVNDYEEVEIDNGLQGVKRCDLIAITYEKNVTTGIETATVNVIKGTSSDSYVDPEYTKGNILIGEEKDDFLLYRVKINGLNIETVEPLFTVTNSILDLLDAQNKTNIELQKSINETNTSLSESIAETQGLIQNSENETMGYVDSKFESAQSSIDALSKSTDASIKNVNNSIDKLSTNTNNQIKDVNDNINAVTSRMDAFVDKNNIAISENSIESVNAGSGSWLSNGTTQLSLSPGTYILQASVTFPSNTTGKRQIAIMDYTNSKNYAVQSSGATNGALDMTTTYFMKLAKTTAVRLAYYQNSGSTLSLTSGKIRALKLCDA